MVQPILQIARDGSCLARARDARRAIALVLPVRSFGVPPFLYKCIFQSLSALKQNKKREQSQAMPDVHGKP